MVANAALQRLCTELNFNHCATHRNLISSSRQRIMKNSKTKFNQFHVQVNKLLIVFHVFAFAALPDFSRSTCDLCRSQDYQQPAKVTQLCSREKVSQSYAAQKSKHPANLFLHKSRICAALEAFVPDSHSLFTSVCKLNKTELFHVLCLVVALCFA